jgi:hypothetical protein
VQVLENTCIFIQHQFCPFHNFNFNFLPTTRPSFSGHKSCKPTNIQHVALAQIAGDLFLYTLNSVTLTSLRPNAHFKSNISINVQVILAEVARCCKLYHVNWRKTSSHNTTVRGMNARQQLRERFHFFQTSQGSLRCSTSMLKKTFFVK